MPTIRNYGRNVVFRPARVARPRSVEELQEVVRAARKVRAVGAAHSWSPAIVTDDTLVSLERMRRPIALDRERRQVTVEGGMRLRELNAHLDRHGLALASLGSIDTQSVAGVIATGTHGSGRAWPCLSAQVARLELVDARGERVTLARGDADFDGAVVGLGALGVVHAVTFDVVPAFRLHDVTGLLRFDEAIEQVADHVGAHDHFKLWWLPPGDHVVAFRYRRTDEPANDSPARRWFKDRLLSVAAYRTLLVVGRMSGRRWIPGINRFLTREVGRPLDRIVPSHVGYLTPVPPVHRESEWAFDARDAAALLREYRALLPADGHTYNFIQEIRFSRADELWLSPGYRRDSIWLGLYNIDPGHWDAQLARFEAFGRAHGGRPHWGKEAAFDRAYLRTQYARLDDFAALARRHDPDGKFRNAWLTPLLGTGSWVATSRDRS
ncbi:MAG TPA: D-arabinono-1,4-lactone oxidase [Kofleriaceae bacterium]|nr:D-arabinono-1,4-lactone oxidase [Kofleriaceae bacterium]